MRKRGVAISHNGQGSFRENITAVIFFVIFERKWTQRMLNKYFKWKCYWVTWIQKVYYSDT